MPYLFRPDVEQVVNELMAGGGYRSEHELLREALIILRNLKSRHENFLSMLVSELKKRTEGWPARLM